VKTSEFDFYLPETLIAAYPPERRDDARLMLVQRDGEALLHSRFSELERLLPRGSLVVLNDSRVLPARLFGRRKTGGHAELLLVRRDDRPVREDERPAWPSAPSESQSQSSMSAPASSGVAPGQGLGPRTSDVEPEARSPRPEAGPDGSETWEAIGRHLGRLQPGAELAFPGGLEAVFLGKEEGGLVRLRLRPPPGTTVEAALDAVGEVPIPPYIVAARRRGLAPAQVADSGALTRDRALDRERYQTVYAAAGGSVAAPTAGLHFTPRLLADLAQAGHQVVTVTLHVGLGTFRPVKVDDVDAHRMDLEWYAVSAGAAAAVEEARRQQRAIVAVGTTVARTLESAARASDDGRVRAGVAASRLFLRPGARFEVVTDLITNFHLPRSTLLMLVSAFAGRDRIRAAYAAAIEAGYRFYSYGDAMFIRGTNTI
jgi:S-adenosylmethionine:tRNA ribosyltransferase-isomerase